MKAWWLIGGSKSRPMAVMASAQNIPVGQLATDMKIYSIWEGNQLHPGPWTW